MANALTSKVMTAPQSKGKAKSDTEDKLRKNPSRKKAIATTDMKPQAREAAPVKTKPVKATPATGEKPVGKTTTRKNATGKKGTDSKVTVSISLTPPNVHMIDETQLDEIRRALATVMAVVEMVRKEKASALTI